MKKLILLMIFITLGFAQTYEVVFTDDFEDGNAYNWEAENGWEVVQIENNYVLQGKGHKWAITPTEYLANSVYKGKVMIKAGSFHLNLLKKTNRYFFVFEENGIDFIADDQNVEYVNKNFGLNVWINFEIKTLEDSLYLFINDEMVIKYKDNNISKILGKLAFEGGENSELLFDDIFIESEKIVYDQNAKWVKTGGPLGGIGYDVRIDPVDPNIIYVTDNWAGIHKSYDGGNSWVQKINGIYSRSGSTNDAIPMFCLTIDPNNPNIVWAGTFGMRGVYKSYDKGDTWEYRAKGIPNVENLTFRSFAVEPGNSDVVYLGCEWSIYDEVADSLGVPGGTARGKVYKTTDGGMNWQEVLDADALVRTIIVDPNNTNTVYAATGIFDRDNIAGSGIFKSVDAGKTWKQINNGIKNLTVGDIEMHPTNSNILLAATGRLNGFSREPDSENGEILRSEDGGETWKEVQVNFDNTEADKYTLFTYIEWDESDYNVVYAAASDRGFYKSTDGGLTFSTTAYNPPKINAGHIISVATHKDRPGIVFANSYGGGVFVSKNRSESWEVASDGYTGNEVTDMAISLTNAEYLIVESRTSSFETNDGGTTWHGNEWIYEFKNVPIGSLEKRSVAIDPENEDIILTGDGGGIYRKEAGVEKFEHVFNIEDYFTEREVAVQSIEFAPSNHLTVYAGCALFGGYTIDRPIIFDPTEEGIGMLKSIDGGKTWTAWLNNGLENSKLNVMEIAVHPTNPDMVYIATLNDGIYKSTDGAANWIKIGNEIAGKDIRSIAIDSNNPDVVYIGTQRDGLYKSVNGGSSFTKLTNGIETEGAIRDIQIDPTNSNRVYAADWLSGVYVSDNAGANWRLINDGLSTRAVQRLAVSHDGVYVYAGTQGEGVFRMTTINKGPVLRFASPDNSNPISITTNTDIEFLVNAYDFNGDDIEISWSLNGSKIDTVNGSSFKVNSAELGNGSHTVTCSITDGVNLPLEVTWEININIVGIENNTPLHYELKQNYPNPFNPSTTIEYKVAEKANVQMEVFNLLGEKVKTLVCKEQSAGNYKIKFDGSNLSSGVYFIRMQAGDFVKHKKMMLIK